MYVFTGGPSVDARFLCCPFVLEISISLVFYSPAHKHNYLLVELCDKSLIVYRNSLSPYLAAWGLSRTPVDL